MWFLTLIARKPKESAIIVLAMVVLSLLFYIRIQGFEYQKALLAYKNPAVKEVRVEGPVVIRYRTITEPGGRKIEERVEERAPIKITRESRPVLLSTRQNRWLAGTAFTGTPRNARNWRLLGGYGWGNRLDLLVGGGYEDGLKGQAQVVLRF